MPNTQDYNNLTEEQKKAIDEEITRKKSECDGLTRERSGLNVRIKKTKTVATNKIAEINAVLDLYDLDFDE